MDTKDLENLITCLENVRKRPAMYLGRTDVEWAFHFLNGFQSAVWVIFGVSRDCYSAEWEQVVEGHGWEWLPVHPYHQMVERGMSPQEVIEELVTMEIELLQRVASRTA